MEKRKKPLTELQKYLISVVIVSCVVILGAKILVGKKKIQRIEPNIQSNSINN